MKHYVSKRLDLFSYILLSCLLKISSEAFKHWPLYRLWAQRGNTSPTKPLCSSGTVHLSSWLNNILFSPVFRLFQSEACEALTLALHKLKCIYYSFLWGWHFSSAVMAFSGISSLEITFMLHNSRRKQQTAMNTDSSIISQWNLRAPASGWKQDRLLLLCSASRCPVEGFSSIMFPFLVSRRVSSREEGADIIPC